MRENSSFIMKKLLTRHTDLYVFHLVDVITTSSINIHNSTWDHRVDDMHTAVSLRISQVPIVATVYYTLADVCMLHIQKSPTDEEEALVESTWNSNLFHVTLVILFGGNWGFFQFPQEKRAKICFFFYFWNVSVGHEAPNVPSYGISVYPPSLPPARSLVNTIPARGHRPLWQTCWPFPCYSSVLPISRVCPVHEPPYPVGLLSVQ